jgi:hypothetical protein
MAAVNLPRGLKHLEPLRVGLYLYLIFGLGILLTPYIINKSLVPFHLLFSGLLFLLEIVMGVWLAWKVRQDTWNFLLVIGQLLNAGLAILSLKEVDVLHIFATGELLVIGCFGILLIRSLSYLLSASDNL